MNLGKTKPPLMTGTVVLLLVLLLFPMPVALSDFVHQKSFLVFILGWFGLYFIWNTQSSFPRGLLVYMGLPLAWVLICLMANFHQIVQPQDVLTELLRYIFSPILFLGAFLYVQRDMQKRPAEDLVLSLVKLYILIELTICIISIAMPQSRAVFSLFFNTQKMMNASYLAGVRMTGTFENPNYLGFVSFFMLVLYRLVSFKHASRLQNVLIVSSLVTMIFLTGSRTALAALCLFMIFTSRWVLMASILASSLLATLLASSRYAVLLTGDLLSDDSFATRYGIVIEALDLVIQQPIFGYSENPLIIADNAVMTLLVRYGLTVLPVLAFSKIWLYVTMLGKSFSWREVLALFVFNLGLPVFLWTGEFLDNFRLFTLYSMIEIILLFYLKQKAGERRATAS